MSPPLSCVCVCVCVPGSLTFDPLPPSLPVQYAGINIGPVHKKDVMKASTMLEHDTQYAPPPPPSDIKEIKEKRKTFKLSGGCVQVRRHPGV